MIKKNHGWVQLWKRRSFPCLIRQSCNGKGTPQVMQSRRWYRDWETRCDGYIERRRTWTWKKNSTRVTSRCVCVIAWQWSRFLSNRFRLVDRNWTLLEVYRARHMSGRKRNAIDRMYPWHAWIKERILTRRNEGGHVYWEGIAGGTKIKCDFCMYLFIRFHNARIQGKNDDKTSRNVVICWNDVCSTWWLSTKDSTVCEGERSRAERNRKWHFAGVMAISGRTRGCAAFIRHSSRMVCRWAMQMTMFMLAYLFRFCKQINDQT